MTTILVDERWVGMSKTPWVLVDGKVDEEHEGQDKIAVLVPVPAVAT